MCPAAPRLPSTGTLPIIGKCHYLRCISQSVSFKVLPNACYESLHCLLESVLRFREVHIMPCLIHIDRQIGTGANCTAAHEYSPEAVQAGGAEIGPPKFPGLSPCCWAVSLHISPALHRFCKSDGAFSSTSPACHSAIQADSQIHRDTASWRRSSRCPRTQCHRSLYGSW